MMKRLRKASQAFFFLLFLALLFLTKYPLPKWIPVDLFLRWDPLVSISTFISSWTIKLTLLPGLILLIATFLWGRFFCFWVCPLGTTLNFIPKVNLRPVRNKSLNPGRESSLNGVKDSSQSGRRFPPNFRYYFLLFLLVSSFFTLELVGIFDPLSLMERTFSLAIFPLVRGRPSFLILGMFLFVILLGLIQRRFWCNKVCPLGALLSLTVKLRRKTAKKEALPLNLSRRGFLTSLGLGLAAIFLKIDPFKSARNLRIIRPPGALPEAKFTSTCLRCGKCMKVCPSGGLQPTFLEAGLGGFWTPRLVPRIGECVEDCNACTQVCPTGAIRRLTLPEKIKAKIGTATINRNRCLSWAKDKLCLVCYEFCPYQAIAVKDVEGIPRPFLLEENCRGCGLCEKVCPVEGEAAIIVYNRISPTLR